MLDVFYSTVHPVTLPPILVSLGHFISIATTLYVNSGKVSKFPLNDRPLVDDAR